MRILLYGGTFNPPHLGHLRAVRAAAAALEPGKILFIPAAIPPHKALAEGSPPPEERLLLTGLAARQIPGAEVSDVEINRTGASFTVDTLRVLRGQYPGDELVFLLGTDMLLSLPTWREPGEICSLASIAVFPRERGREPEIVSGAEILRNTYGARVYVIRGEPVEVSSTEIRSALPERGGRELLPGEVYGRIIRQRLYGARPELGWMRGEAYAYLKPKRVPHVRGVEEEAARLARRWGIDPGEAAEAAICHDITKALDREDQLRLCEKYVIMASDAGGKLFHARTGAALARDLFGLTDDAAIAIRFHTTGRPGMSRLEIITYLADYIEPNRADFPGLPELRLACYEDLDQAMELASRMSLDEVAAKGETPHHDTRDCHEWYLRNLRRRGLPTLHADGVPDTI